MLTTQSLPVNPALAAISAAIGKLGKAHYYLTADDGDEAVAVDLLNGAAADVAASRLAVES